VSGAHSILAPSRASRRVQCRGSCRLEAAHPETEEREEAREGTASHELAEMMIDALVRGGINMPTPTDTVGQLAANDVEWTRESYDGALMYAEDVQRVARLTGVFGGEHFGTERRVHAARIHELSWGTLDQFIYDAKHNRLYIWDYKFGRVLVEPENNWQLIIYAVALIDWLISTGADEQTLTLCLTIVQPRAYHPDGPAREWRLRATDLRAYSNIMSAVEVEALGDNPSFSTGPECKHCSGRHVCETIQRTGYAIAEYVASPVNVALSPAALGLELSIMRQAVALAKARLEGLEGQAIAHIATGPSLPGWQLQPGRGSTVWVEDDETVITTGAMMGLDLRRGGACTPKQALDAGAHPETISAFSTKKPGALKLVPFAATKLTEVFFK